MAPPRSIIPSSRTWEERIAEAQANAFASNPYYSAGSAIGAMKLPIFGGEGIKKPSLMEALGLSAAQGLLGGIGSGIGERQANESLMEQFAPQRERSRRLADALGVAGAYYKPMLDNPQTLGAGLSGIEDQYENELALKRQLSAQGPRIRSKYLSNGMVQDYEYDPQTQQETPYGSPRSRTAQAPFRSISPETQAFLENKLGVKPRNLEEANIVSRAFDLGLKEDSEIRRQEKFEYDVKMDSGERKIVSYEPITDAVINKTEAVKIKKENADLAKMEKQLDQLIATGDANGFMKVFGEDAQLQSAVYAMIFNQQRVNTNSGAKLEGKEAKYLADMTPATFLQSPVGAMMKALTGKNQVAFAKDLKRLMQEAHDYKLMDAYGLKRRDRSLSSYPPELINKVGPSAAFQAAMPQPNQPQAPAAGGAPAPGQDPAFDAWLKAQGME